MERTERHEINNLLCVVLGQIGLIQSDVDCPKKVNDRAVKAKAAAKNLNEIIRASDFPFSVYIYHLDALEDTVASIRGNLKEDVNPSQRSFFDMLIKNIERKIGFLRKLQPEKERICFNCDGAMIVDVAVNQFKCLDCNKIWIIKE